MSHDDRTEKFENTNNESTNKLDERVSNQAWDDIKANAFSAKDLSTSPQVVLDDHGRICIPNAFPRSQGPGSSREPKFIQCTYPEEPTFAPREPKFIQCTYPEEPAFSPREPRNPKFIQCTYPAEPVWTPIDPCQPVGTTIELPDDPTFKPYRPWTPSEPGSWWKPQPDDGDVWKPSDEEIAKILKDIRGRGDDLNPVTKEELAKAEQKIDQKIEVNEANLSPQEKELRKKLDHAILEGNTKELEKIIREHKDNPQELNRIMALVNSDMKEAGIHIGWHTGNMMMGDDKDMHPVGTLTIFRDGAREYVSMSTDSRIGTGLGGPITWRDGQAILNFLAISGSADAEMKQIGNSGVRKINGSGKQTRSK